MPEPNNNVDPLNNPPTPNNPPTDPPVDPPANPPTGGLSQAEVDAIVQRARQEEKDKLYAELNRFKDRDRASQSQIKELETQIAQLKENADQTGSLKTKIETLETELAKLKEDKNVSTQQPNTQPTQNPELEALKTALAESNSKFDKAMEALNQLQTITQQQQAEKIRQEVLTQKGQNLFPEYHTMVTGNTPEEIENSINNLLKVQQATYQRAAATATAPAAVNPEAALNLGADITPDKIRNMDMKDWAEFRKKLPGLGGGI